MKEINSIELFDRYLDNKMAETEKEIFGQKLRADADFFALFMQHQDARLAARLDGRQALKSRLSQRHLAQPKSENPSSDKNWLWLLGGLFAVAALFFWWKNGQNLPSQHIPKQEADPEKTAPTEQPKAIESIKPSQPVAENSSEKQPAHLSTERLFAAHFKTYQSAEISGMLRSDEDEPGAFQLFLTAYLRGSHAEALRLFENLSGEDKSNENIQFLQANSLLAAEKTDAAIVVFEKLAAQKNSKYASEARWFLALAKLKKGDLARAKVLFEQILNAKNVAHRAAAEAILSDLKK